MKSSIDFIRNLTDTYQATSSIPSAEAVNKSNNNSITPEPEEVGDSYLNSHEYQGRSSVGNFRSSIGSIISSYTTNSEDADAAANQCRVIQSRKECRLHIRRLTNEIGELRRREEERLHSSVLLLQEKYALEHQLATQKEQHRDLQLRFEELRQLQTDRNKHMKDIAKEIDALVEKAKALELQKTQLKLSELQTRAELDQMHVYDSGISILIYNLKENIYQQKLEQKKLQDQLERLRSDRDELQQILLNCNKDKTDTALQTRQVLESCAELKRNIVDLTNTSQELETMNDALRSALVASIAENKSQRNNGFVSKLFHGKHFHPNSTSKEDIHTTNEA